jgi:hypothetical protein
MSVKTPLGEVIVKVAPSTTVAQLVVLKAALHPVAELRIVISAT